MNIINGITLIIWQTASCLNSVLVPWTWPTDMQHRPNLWSLVLTAWFGKLLKFHHCKTGFTCEPRRVSGFCICETKAGSLARFSWKFGTFIFIMRLFSERKELEISVSTESLVVFAEHDEHEVWLITRMRLYRLLYLLVLEPVFLKGMSVSDFLKALPLPLLFIRLLSSRLTCEFET